MNEQAAWVGIFAQGIKQFRAVSAESKRILVAPLNWGLGHATRCIPLIRALQEQGAAVVIASDGRALELLKHEFPLLPAYELPGYNIQYRTANMVGNMAVQLPKISRAVYLEHRRTEELTNLLRLDGILSDNRYGCFTKKIPCVFLTHQCRILTPSPALSGIVNFFNRQFMRQFSECWIPDVEAGAGLSGELSHGFFQKNARYVGALSRMVFFKTEKKYDAIAVLSGPEPQRTQFERAIIEQAAKLPYRFLIVLGKTNEPAQRYFIHKHIEVATFLTSKELNSALSASGIFIGRSGYSTIMDLAMLGTKALLVPTPGQTEQEYLAEKFRREGIFAVQQQSELDLRSGLEAAAAGSGLKANYFDEKAVEEALRMFLTG